MNRHAESKVSAWALKYQVSEKVKAERYQDALALSKKIVKDFPELTVAKDALYEQWIIHFILLHNPEAAESVISEYESTYGLDEDLIRMKLKSGLIDNKTARVFKAQISDKQDSLFNQKETPALPQEYSLSQNYPNPFNPTTTISYTLPKASNVILKIYDILGKEVVTLVNEFKSAGWYSIKFDASSLASGIYFYRLQAGNFVETKKLLITK